MQFLLKQLCKGFLFSCFLLSMSFAQTNLSTFFSPADLLILESLVLLAEQNDSSVLEANLSLQETISQTALLGRLKEALSVTATANLESDTYRQALPSYGFKVSLNVLSLIPEANTLTLETAKLKEAKLQTRVCVVQAFLDYKLAVEAAQNAAFALESSETNFRVLQARVTVGDATLADQLRAQTLVSNAALALLNANATVITTFETLAALTG